MRLAIDIEWSSDGRVAAYRHANANGHCFTAFESSREDRYVNTRRAIVRAAAEVGKGMLTQDEFVRMFPGRFDDEEVTRAAAVIGEGMG